MALSPDHASKHDFNLVAHLCILLTCICLQKEFKATSKAFSKA